MSHICWRERSQTNNNEDTIRQQGAILLVRNPLDTLSVQRLVIELLFQERDCVWGGGGRRKDLCTEVTFGIACRRRVGLEGWLKWLLSPSCRSIRRSRFARGYLNLFHVIVFNILNYLIVQRVIHHHCGIFCGECECVVGV